MHCYIQGETHKLIPKYHTDTSVQFIDSKINTAQYWRQVNYKHKLDYLCKVQSCIVDVHVYSIFLHINHCHTFINIHTILLHFNASFCNVTIMDHSDIKIVLNNIRTTLSLLNPYNIYTIQYSYVVSILAENNLICF